MKDSNHSQILQKSWSIWAAKCQGFPTETGRVEKVSTKQIPLFQTIFFFFNPSLIFVSRTHQVFRKYPQIRLILDCHFPEIIFSILSVKLPTTGYAHKKWHEMDVALRTDSQPAFAAQLRLLRSSWKWLRKWDAARTSNMFPALPAGQDFQTCGGSDKDKSFFP